MGDIITVLKALVNILEGVNKLWGLYSKKGAKPIKSSKSDKETINEEIQ